MKIRALSFMVLFSASPNIFADQLLVLSGGGNPLGNHYSQYLQTKTLADDMRTRFPALNPAVMFAAGNRAGQAPVLADVHRVVNQGELSFQQMSPGTIEGNTAATLANVNAYFAQPALEKMSPKETLFMLVSDHGMPFIHQDGSMSQTFDNNCIDLWNFRANLKSGQITEGPVANRCLSKDRLTSLLNNQVSAGRVVFAMSQCYSGGFHMMSVKNLDSYPSADPRICGFTAATEDTTASGCTPDVDGPGYQGYERSFTEQLTGVDVVSGRRLRPARTSLREAHAEATLEDLTKDIPLATSDFYLWKWALAIEKSGFRPRAGTLDAGQIREIVNQTKLGAAQSASPAYRGKEEFFVRVQKSLDLYPEYRAIYAQDLPAHIELEKELTRRMAAAEQQWDNHASPLEMSKNHVLTEWHRAVLGGKSTLSPRERAIESQVYSRGNADRMVLLSMSIQAITQPDLARSLSEYQAKREDYAIKFAESSSRQDLNETAAAIKELKLSVAQREDEVMNVMKRHGHVRRLLIYRQVLGALNALTQMKDAKALAETEGLMSCENAELK